MARLNLHATISAPVETVFDVMTDYRGYAKLTPLRSSTLEREGTPAPNGVGAVRVLALVGPPIREEITEFERPHRYAYRALSGVPAKEHRGEVELRPAGEGTALTWRVDSTPKLPIPDRLYVPMVKLAISQLLKGVVKGSEARARAGAVN